MLVNYMVLVLSQPAFLLASPFCFEFLSEQLSFEGIALAKMKIGNLGSSSG
jgi:hypothetical protein